MTAKKTKIKDLQEELRERDKLIAMLKKTINEKTRTIKQIRREQVREVALVVELARRTRKQFESLIAWNKLGNYQDVPLWHLVSLVKYVEDLVTKDELDETE